MEARKVRKTVAVTKTKGVWAVAHQIKAALAGWLVACDSEPGPPCGFTVNPLCAAGRSLDLETQPLGKPVGHQEFLSL